MGRPPAVVIIARHGARLDAADEQWHLTSPTPYDPPLTYGGWLQSRALGVRIATLLQAREESLQSHTPDRGRRRSVTGEKDSAEGLKQARSPSRAHRGRRRKHKVIIHTSPFLRCVQTAVAISAGIAQTASTTTVPRSLSRPKSHTIHHGLSHSYVKDQAHLAAIYEPDEDALNPNSSREKNRSGIKKVELRIDAFLGEWLSPDYYESITPPPSSVLMVAGAKADLLRRGENVDASHNSLNQLSSQTTFPGGWGNSSPSIAVHDEHEEVIDFLPSLSDLGDALPGRERSGSHTSSRSSGRNSLRAAQMTSKSGSSVVYVPPKPRYAISPSDQIPAGYVAHARDACMNINYQWDSMRTPFDWGDGGEYGEEWSAMHKRFRKGLQSMIAWYWTGGKLCNNEKTAESKLPVEEEDDDTDTVLILVTHGAGCNALIGALTNQPVLMDVGMASLTMAMRKDAAIHPATTPTGYKPLQSPPLELNLADEYDVKLTASTEHLRSDSTPNSATSSKSQSPMLPPQQNSPYRPRAGSKQSRGPTTSLIEGTFRSPMDLAARPSAISLAGLNNTPLQRSSSTGSTTAAGLWRKPSPESVPLPSTPATAPLAAKPDLASIVAQNQAVMHENAQISTVAVEDDDPMTILPSLRTSILATQNSQRGLWDASPIGIGEDGRVGMKRRWTINENRV
ncbi:MAG: hypothetical protein MMC33_006980 [Icmadophila ericetorum]|nr:hypothetical protein [Icmadophila ericetorum]